MPAAHAPLALLRSLHRKLANPVRVDAKRNQVVIDATGWSSLMTRLRNCIAHLEKQEGGQ